jgi:PhnB protein
MKVQSYLFFDGRCEEALNFYRDALGAEVTMLMRFKDNPEPMPSEGAGCAGSMATGDKVMHAAFTIGETQLMASDGRAGGQPEFKGVAQSISTANDAETKRLFDALADGGQVQMPLGKTFFASSFGMVNDRFGVPWMVITEKA